MSLHARIVASTLAVLAMAVPLAACEELPKPRFEPTPLPVVDAMLELADVRDHDTVYDLGSGDGRIVIAAAKQGARAVGIEIDPALVERARRNAQSAGVAARTRFLQQDLFAADIRPATVVTLYLLPEVNLALRPKLLRDLKPGARVVSHSHDMGDWLPERTLEVTARDGKRHRIHLWTLPPRKDQPPVAAADR